MFTVVSGGVNIGFQNFGLPFMGDDEALYWRAPVLVG